MCIYSTVNGFICTCVCGQCTHLWFSDLHILGTHDKLLNVLLGVLNFVPANGPTFGDIITSSPHLAGINFTGSAK